MMKSSGFLSLLKFVCLVKGLVPPNPRLQRSLRLTASVEPSKGRDDEIEMVKNKFKKVEAKIPNVEADNDEDKVKIAKVEAEIEEVKAALAGRSDDAGDYANYVSMDFEKREEKLMPRISELQAEKNILLTRDQSSAKQRVELSEQKLSDQQALTTIDQFVDIKQQDLAGLSVKNTRFYVRPESVDLWNKIENVTNEGNNLRVSGPPGTGKSTEAWAWALWKE